MKNRQLKKKEKYILDSERKIYSFDNNDEIPENSIIIGYNDDDSGDDDGYGYGYRDVIESWFLGFNLGKDEDSKS